MAIRKTEGFVLHSRDIRETSRIITLFTKDFGKIKGLVKGIRTKEGSSRFGTRFEVYSLNSLVYYEKYHSDIFLISQGDLIERFGNIRDDIEKSAFAIYFAELLDRAIEICAPDEAMFDLMLHALKKLETEDAESVSIQFQVKLLDMLGILPSFEYGKSTMSKGSVNTIEHIRKKKAIESMRIKIISKIKTEISGVLEDILRNTVSDKLQSLNYLKKMRFV